MITRKCSSYLAFGCISLLGAMTAVPAMAGTWQYPGEISVAQAYNDVYFTDYDTTTQEGLAALVADHGTAMQSEWNVSTAATVTVLAYETANNSTVGIDVAGDIIPIYTPSAWTSPSRGWVDDPVGGTSTWSAGVIDIATVLMAQGYTADTPFTFVVGSVTMNGTNTYRLANNGTNGGFLLAYNEGGLNSSDGDANEPILYVNAPPTDPGSCNGLRPTIVGTSDRDVIKATDGPDVIMALGGDDVIYGYGGDDVICGGDGVDVIHGGDGNDTIFGGDGGDTIYAEGGDDVVHGGGGDDTVNAGDGNDTVYGDAGDDTLLGKAGNDIIHGGSGNDTLTGNDGDDQLYGDDGDDFVYGGDGNDTLVGGPGNDRITGSTGNDTLEGDAGDDQLYGGLGDDNMDGGDGTDLCYGTGGTDTATACENVTGVEVINP